ncbi:MAG: gephyrin-like molybdotransferase Glp [Alphaproteobacteria bacterium]
MPQLSDDCFAFGGALMPAEEALARLKAAIRPIAERETVPLRKAAGRILAEDVVSRIDVPPHDNAAVDGYAVYRDDLGAEGETRLPIIGRVAAGAPLPHPARRGAAVRVFTGAPMPHGESGPGPDTVIMQEDCREADGAVLIPPGAKRGINRRRAGEDVRAGDTVLRAGRRLKAQDVGLAGSIGLAELAVYRRLKVAVFSTGDEVHEPGRALAPGGIYDANRYVVMSLIEQLGGAVTDLGILPDRLAAVRDALRDAALGHDALITSGGMSTGEEDHLKAAVEAQGTLHFWRLAIRPGRPLALGQIGRVPFIGLPGNPVAVVVTFALFARPLLLGLGGASELDPVHYRVRADFDYKKKEGRREWLRARLVPGADGTLAAEKFARDGAEVLSSTVFADGLIELPEDVTLLERGAMVDFLPFSELR